MVKVLATLGYRNYTLEICTSPAMLCVLENWIIRTYANFVTMIRMLRWMLGDARIDIEGKGNVTAANLSVGTLQIVVVIVASTNIICWTDTTTSADTNVPQNKSFVLGVIIL